MRGLLLLLAAAILAGLAPAAAPLQLDEQLSRARTALVQGDAPGALRALDTVLRLEPSLTMLHRPAAYAALDANDPAGALSHMEQSLISHPGAPDMECLRLEARVRAGELAALEPLPAACQDSTRLRRLRAQALIASGEVERALEELETSLSLAPADAEMLHLRSIFSAALRPETALPAILAARAAGADDPLLADLEALLRASAGASAFESSMRSGQVLLKYGRFEEAALAFERAAGLQPSDTSAQAYLAFAQAPADPQAMVRLRALRLQSPEVVLPYLLEGMALRQGGAPSSAIPVLEAASSLTQRVRPSWPSWPPRSSRPVTSPRRRAITVSPRKPPGPIRPTGGCWRSSHSIKVWTPPGWPSPPPGTPLPSTRQVLRDGTCSATPISWRAMCCWRTDCCARRSGWTRVRPHPITTWGWRGCRWPTPPVHAPPLSPCCGSIPRERTPSSLDGRWRH